MGGAVKLDLDFRIELQYSDELDPPTFEIRQAQEKLEYLLSTVKHPLALKQFLGLIANAPTHNSATRWYVWKGKTGRGKGQFHSSLRFVLQSSRVSNELIVLTVRFRDTHDKYERYRYHFCSSNHRVRWYSKIVGSTRSTRCDKKSYYNHD
jgi:hypothetical protein